MVNNTTTKPLNQNKMEWISVKDENKIPPFEEQVLVSCGHGRFFAWLIKIEITKHEKKMIWHKLCPSEFDDYEPTHWMKIEEPK